MQKPVIIIGVLAVIAGAIYLTMADTRRGVDVPPTVASAAPVTQAPTLAGTPPPRIPAPVSAAAQSALPDPPEDAGVEPDAAKPTGPVEYSLGTHTVSMRDSKNRVKLEVVVTVDNPVTLRELRSKRRKLVRMLYFLSAHRTEDGMTDSAGQNRFLGDLRERFTNIMRTGDLVNVEFRSYEIVGPALPALPAAPPAPE